MASEEEPLDLTKKDSVNGRPPDPGKMSSQDSTSNKINQVEGGSEVRPDPEGGPTATPEIPREAVPPDRQEADSTEGKSHKRQRPQRKADRTRQRLDKAASKLQIIKEREMDDDIVSFPRASHRSRFEDNHAFGIIRDSRIYPDRQFPLYIKRIDEMLVLDAAIQKLNKKASDLYGSICNEFRREALPPSFGGLFRKALFDSCIDAYKGVKNKLLKDEGNDYIDHERLLAALEATGQIILTPHLMKHLDGFGRDDLHLKTKHYTSPKTCEILEKLVWERDSNEIVFYFIERTNLRFGVHD